MEGWAFLLGMKTGDRENHICDSLLEAFRKQAVGTNIF
jgi:hypothetical protein